MNEPSDLTAKAARVLRTSAALIRKGWAQRASAVDALGNVTDTVDDPKAVAWCALSAIYRADEKRVAQVRTLALDALYEQIVGAPPRKSDFDRNRAIFLWNDYRQRTAEQVAQAMEAAAESLDPAPLTFPEVWVRRQELVA